MKIPATITLAQLHDMEANFQQKAKDHFKDLIHIGSYLGEVVSDGRKSCRSYSFTYNKRKLVLSVSNKGGPWNPWAGDYETIWSIYVSTGDPMTVINEIVVSRKDYLCALKVVECKGEWTMVQDKDTLFRDGDWFSFLLDSYLDPVKHLIDTEFQTKQEVERQALLNKLHAELDL